MPFDSGPGLASIPCMRLSSKLGLLFVVTGLLGLGCAPRISTNLYARWNQQDQTRRAEMEREEKIRAEVERRMGKATNSDAQPAENPPALLQPAEPADTNSEPSTPDISSDSAASPDTSAASPDTPPIGTKTATSGRAVKPIFKEVEEEEETIY